MLQTQESKLLTQWQGPFEVNKLLGPTSYELVMPG